MKKLSRDIKEKLPNTKTRISELFSKYEARHKSLPRVNNLKAAVKDLVTKFKEDYKRLKGINIDRKHFIVSLKEEMIF